MSKIKRTAGLKKLKAEFVLSRLKIGDKTQYKLNGKWIDVSVMAIDSKVIFVSWNDGGNTMSTQIHISRWGLELRKIPFTNEPPVPSEKL